ncbi:MAG: hypothetical protein ACR2NP_05850, partial [Pirellulaceae bacterium]
MKSMQIAAVALLCSSFCAGYLFAQDKVPVSDQELAERQVAQAERAQRARDEADRAARQEHVLQLTNRAAALRGEFNFEAAAQVEAEIRQLCWDYDPRLIRINDLKQHASASRLEGRMLDADMYEREAERVLAALKVEYGDGANPSPESSSRVQGNPMISQSSSIEEIADLRERVVALTN